MKQRCLSLEWFSPERKEKNLTGQLVLRSSQGLMPCGREEDCRSSVSGQRKAQEFSHPVMAVHRLSLLLW